MSGAAACCLRVAGLQRAPGRAPAHRCPRHPAPRARRPAAEQEQGSEGGVQYVSHRQAKEYYDDGRRRNLFFLIDQQGGPAGWDGAARERRAARLALAVAGRAAGRSAGAPLPLPPQAASTWRWWARSGRRATGTTRTARCRPSTPSGR